MAGLLTVSAASGAWFAHAQRAYERWPHEPSGLQLVSDQPWASSPSLGWEAIWGPSRVVVDPSAPGSPPGVLEITYPAGFVGGSAPGTVVRKIGRARTVFVGLWWKPSAAWQGHESNVNKLAFLFPREGGDITLVMYGPPGGPYDLRVLPQFVGHPSDWLLPDLARVPITLGEWHRIEWLVQSSSDPGVADGRSIWWLDGQLLGAREDVAIPVLFTEFKFSPTWGGVGDRKREEDTFRLDHIRLSIR